MKKIINPLCYALMVETLRKQSYIHVPFSISLQQIKEAINAFFEFLKEPELIRKHIDFSIAKYHRRGDVGFKHREADDSAYNDNKDFFHYHPAIMRHYSNFINMHPVLKSFIEKAHPIWLQVYNVTKQIMEVFEQHHPGIINRIYNTENPHILLRFLKYEWENSGKYLAKPHYDAGSFTLAIAESCQGLRIGKNPEELKTVQHKPNHAIFMLSSNFKKLMNVEQVHAGWHDVIQLDETKMGKQYARWAIVAFIEAHDVYALPRSETHKWFTQTET